jgi:glutaconate CoA-transferase subunit A
MSADRTDQLISIPEAVSFVQDGMTIGLSGFSYQNPPMAIVRELIRRGVRDLTLVSGPTSGIETDILIGAGCVRRLVSACVAFECINAIAPAFRQRAAWHDREAARSAANPPPLEPPGMPYHLLLS